MTSPLSSCSSRKWCSLNACINIFFAADCASLYRLCARIAVRWTSSALCVVPPYTPGLGGGTIRSVTCLFSSQSELSHTKYDWPWSLVAGSEHTLDCDCRLISLLALLILIRVGWLLLQVISVRLISSSLVVVFCLILTTGMLIGFVITLILCRLVSSIVGYCQQYYYRLLSYVLVC